MNAKEQKRAFYGRALSKSSQVFAGWIAEIRAGKNAIYKGDGYVGLSQGEYDRLRQCESRLSEMERESERWHSEMLDMSRQLSESQKECERELAEAFRLHKEQCERLQCECDARNAETISHLTAGVELLKGELNGIDRGHSVIINGENITRLRSDLAEAQRKAEALDFLEKLLDDGETMAFKNPLFEGGTYVVNHKIGKTLLEAIEKASAL